MTHPHHIDSRLACWGRALAGCAVRDAVELALDDVGPSRSAMRTRRRLRRDELASRHHAAARRPSPTERRAA